MFKCIICVHQSGIGFVQSFVKPHFFNFLKNVISQLLDDNNNNKNLSLNNIHEQNFLWASRLERILPKYFKTFSAISSFHSPRVTSIYPLNESFHYRL